MNDLSTIEGLAKEIRLCSALLCLADPDDPDENPQEIAKEKRNLEELKENLRKMLLQKSPEELKQFEGFMQQLVPAAHLDPSHPQNLYESLVAGSR